MVEHPCFQCHKPFGEGTIGFCPECAKTSGVNTVRGCGYCFKTIDETFEDDSQPVEQGMSAYWYCHDDTLGQGSLCLTCTNKYMAPYDEDEDGPTARKDAPRAIKVVNVEIVTTGKRKFKADILYRLADGTTRVFRKGVPPDWAPAWARMAWNALESI